jgi:hypothetical protein
MQHNISMNYVLKLIYAHHNENGSNYDSRFYFLLRTILFLQWTLCTLSVMNISLPKRMETVDVIIDYVEYCVGHASYSFHTTKKKSQILVGSINQHKKVFSCTQITRLDI